MGRSTTLGRPVPGDRRGGACPYSTEWGDEICGAETTHYCTATRCWFCAEHYTVVLRMLAVVAAAAVEDGEMGEWDPASAWERDGDDNGMDG